MKIAKSFLAALLFTGTLGAFNNAMAADSVLSKEEVTTGGYCHLQFPAIRQNTLGEDDPVLSQSDIIDFYGPCDEDPRGKDQVWEQKQEKLHEIFKDS
jgi:hypothetical protein